MASGCKACGAAVVFGIDDTGKVVPMDAEVQVFELEGGYDGEGRMVVKRLGRDTVLTKHPFPYCKEIQALKARIRQQQEAAQEKAG